MHNRGSVHWLAHSARKVVIVTGAGSGIGKAIAFRFAEEGANVAVNKRARSDTGYCGQDVVGRTMAMITR